MKVLMLFCVLISAIRNYYWILASHIDWYIIRRRYFLLLNLNYEDR
jgi:hypothetical protein